jgi:hypothetical protein
MQIVGGPANSSGSVEHVLNDQRALTNGNNIVGWRSNMLWREPKNGFSVKYLGVLRTKHIAALANCTCRVG